MIAGHSGRKSRILQQTWICSFHLSQSDCVSLVGVQGTFTATGPTTGNMVVSHHLTREGPSRADSCRTADRSGKSLSTAV